MQLRTDLALEARELAGDSSGVDCLEQKIGDVTVSRIDVLDENGERAIGKPAGRYVTVELPPLTDSAFIPDERYEVIKNELSEMLPDEGLVLVVGLGNRRITPDALGPRTAAQVVATRHITEELERSAGFFGLRPTAVLAPGVLGQTGIEVCELLRTLCDRLKPAAAIVIDAMASRKLARLGCTVQLSDAGISPGAGVGNNRPAINRGELGVPVISMGVPTVVEASTLAHDLAPGCDDSKTAPRGESMIVTPREIDLLTDRAARLLALSVNSALHPELDPTELLSIM